MILIFFNALFLCFLLAYTSANAIELPYQCLKIKYKCNDLPYKSRYGLIDALDISTILEITLCLIVI